MTALLLHNPRSARSAGRTLRAVVRALAGATDLKVVHTACSGHATELARSAVERGCEAVVVLAGDGTVNEALQAVAGSDVPLAPLPSGSTNVWARRLGYPNRAVPAARLLADSLRAGRHGAVPLGMANGRWFAFNAGFGLDAAVVRRVDRRPGRKRALGQAAFVASAVAALRGGYEPAEIGVKVEGSAPSEPVAMVVCANGDPFSFLGRWPLRVCGGASPEEGVSLLGLTRADIPTLLRAVSAAAAGDVRELPRARAWGRLEQATLSSDAPLPLQVDGDDLGDTTTVDLRSVPSAVRVVRPAGHPGARVTSGG